MTPANLRKMRVAAGLSRRQLSGLMGWDLVTGPSTLCQLESGRRPITSDMADRLREAIATAGTALGLQRLPPPPQRGPLAKKELRP